MIRRALVPLTIVAIVLAGGRHDPVSAEPSHESARPDTLQRIAFGSCAREDRPQPIWDAILAADPDLFIWGGDNIYADTRDMDVMQRKYERLRSQPGYARLMQSVPVLATWDDHDYGENDAGAEFPLKAESQQRFLDFLGVPQDSHRRAREGVYHAETFGPPGRRVQVILLDTRYHRSPLQRAPGPRARGVGPYVPSEDPAATVLGHEQWRWLRQQLEQPAELRLIVSSIQVVANEHGWETWGNFPNERQRLFDLIRATGARGVIILSGDRHHAELSRLDAEAVDYPLYDLTASGMNQSGMQRDEPNAFRVGNRYAESHFGSVTIDWDAPEPAVTLAIFDAAGEPHLEERVPLAALRP